MAKRLELVAGIPRMITDASAPTIYDKIIEIVESDPTGDQLVGPITAGTSITLPASETYDSNELQLWWSGSRLTYALDYVYVGTSPRTQFQLLFDLEVGDKIKLYMDRDV
jgi:hypothetical protein